MTEWVTYGELADQYEQSAQLLHELIRKRTQQMNKESGQAARGIKSQLMELYTMRREALETAAKLREYSRKEVTP